MSDDTVISLITLVAFLLGIGIAGLAAHNNAALYQLSPIMFGLVFVLACVIAGLMSNQNSHEKPEPRFATA